MIADNGFISQIDTTTCFPSNTALNNQNSAAKAEGDNEESVFGKAFDEEP
jgi:hypothetical protein